MKKTVLAIILAGVCGSVLADNSHTVSVEGYRTKVATRVAGYSVVEGGQMTEGNGYARNSVTAGTFAYTGVKGSCECGDLAGSGGLSVSFGQTSGMSRGENASQGTFYSAGSEFSSKYTSSSWGFDREETRGRGKKRGHDDD